MPTAIGGPSSHSYRERFPTAQLQRLLSCVWIQHVAEDGPAYDHRTVPNGCADLVCALDTGAVRIAGPKRTPVVERLAPGRTVVGVRFRPGATPAMLRASVSDLVDADLDLDDLWGRSAGVIGAKVAEARSPEQAVSILEREVGARWAHADEPDPVVAEAVKRLQPWRRGDIGGATSDLFMSPRQLRRRFAASLGYGPKTLQRILRFQAFLALGNTYHRADVTLAWLAAAAGYADQAHLSRECARLTDLTPRAFLAELRQTCGSNHDHAASFAPLLRALGQPVQAQRTPGTSASFKTPTRSAT